MQSLPNRMHYTKNAVESIYGEYSVRVFCNAIRKLIGLGFLRADEQKLLAEFTGKLKGDRGIIRKSHFIYLSNGILLEENPEKVAAIKSQLMLELAVRMLEAYPENKAYYRGENAFSLGLNMEILPGFDSITKDNKDFVFYCNDDEVLRLGKNESWSITNDIGILEQDRNPFNVHGDHPDEEFIAYDLGGIPKEKWVAQFRNAYGTIQEKVPELYDEIYSFLDAIVPHGYKPGKQMSSSYSKSPGILYLSYTDDDIEQAEAIIHEVHHTIFNIIQWKYRLLNNDDSLKYYSAYRPDARHIRGCFIGLHAFVAVQNFYGKLAEGGNQEYTGKFLNAYIKNGMVIGVLEKYAGFTKEGKLLFEDVKIKYHHDKGFFDGLKEKNADIYNKCLSECNSHLEDAKKSNEILLH